MEACRGSGLARQDGAARFADGPQWGPLLGHGFARLAVEHPRFPLDALPAIPAGWVDTSWGNDTGPSFEAPNGMTIYLSYPDSHTRDDEPDTRFGIVLHGDETIDILSTDDWTEVLAVIDAQPSGKA